MRADKNRALPGTKRGMLTLMEFSTKLDTRGYSVGYWLCKCDCGNTKSIRASNLNEGRVTACGCQRRPMIGPFSKRSKN